MRLERNGDEWFVNGQPAPFHTKEEAEIFGLRQHINQLQQVIEALKKSRESLDVTAPDAVDILIRHDRKVVWVNVNGVCAFRACQIKELHFSVPPDEE